MAYKLMQPVSVNGRAAVVCGVDQLGYLVNYRDDYSVAWVPAWKVKAR